MTKIHWLILLFFPFILTSQSNFKVELNLKGLNTNKIRVYYLNKGKIELDTLTSSKPDYVLWEGSTMEPQLVRMEVLDTSLYLTIGKAVAFPPPLQFLLTNDKITINGDAKEIWTSNIISTSEEVNIYEKFRLQDTPISQELWATQKEQNRKAKAQDTTEAAFLKDKAAALRKKNQALRIKFIDENPAAFTSILMLQSLFLILPINEIDKKFTAFDSKYKSTQTAIELAAKIQTNKNTAIGQPAVTFVQTSFDGKVIDLAAMKGKVVLLDFWGSWCVPCRQNHPKLKETYSKYKSLGLEIVGIANESVNKSKPKDLQDASWRKAIQEDGIEWPNLLYDSELNDIVKSYDIMGYPTKYLIDQKGNIVLKILGNSMNQHELLAKKLVELLGQ